MLYKFNPTQLLYIALGVDHIVFTVGTRGKSCSFTKKGPGRRHRQGKKRS